MSGQSNCSSLSNGDSSVEFNTFTEDPVLPDDVDREQAESSSLQNTDTSRSRYLPSTNPVPLEETGNQYYGKIMGMDAVSEPYSEDLVMIGSSVDICEDSKPPLLLAEEQTLPGSYEQKSCEAVNSTSQTGKTILVMPEDIEAAGLSMQNLSGLTEAQFATLVDIAERRQRSIDPTETSLISLDQYGDQMAGSSSNGDSLTIVIAEDGSLKLTDATGCTFSFDSAQLDALRIDVNNLTDESIQQIVQLAMPAISISNRTIVSSKAEVEHFERGQTLSSDIAAQRFPFKNDIVNTTEATDESVQLDRPNRTGIQNPSIRYIKNGKCKVQYDDGRFEWVGEDNVDFCEGKILEHSDHSGYHACNSSVEDESSAVHGSTTQVKRQHTTNSSFAAAPSPPKRRSTVQTPNFCCPVCDRKVYQKEPSYIVIRLPACDDCTKERMIVLDERTKRVGVHSIQK